MHIVQAGCVTLRIRCMKQAHYQSSFMIIRNWLLTAEISAKITLCKVIEWVITYGVGRIQCQFSSRCRQLKFRYRMPSALSIGYPNSKILRILGTEFLRDRIRSFIKMYLTEVYFRRHIVTAYIVFFWFPILAFVIYMLGDWTGSLRTIVKAF